MSPQYHCQRAKRRPVADKLQQILMRLILASLSAPLRAAALRRASFFRNAASSTPRKFTPASAAAAIAAAGAALYAYSSRAETAQAPAADAAALEAAAASRAGTVVPGLPDYTLQQVSQHKTSADRIWVTYRNAVYDVTDFVENHPGGMARIMLGGAWGGGGWVVLQLYFFNDRACYPAPFVTRRCSRRQH
jgi:hypothetical protein